MALNGPIDRNFRTFSSSQFSGDDFTKPHKMILGKTAFMQSLGNLPAPSEKVEVAIVGGGMSGLISAFELRTLNPVVLEQAPRFGGNAKGESWKGLDFSIGAAYFVEPEEDSPIADFLNEIGIDKIYKAHESGDPLVLNGKKIFQAWQQGTTAKNKAQFEKIRNHFVDILNEQNGLKYPEIPSEKSAGLQLLSELDRMSFKEYVQNILKSPIDPHLEAVFENYFWSSAGASPDEISAAMGINFFADEFGAMAICPGGNSAVAEKILERLVREGHSANLRTQSVVFHVEVNDEGVLIYYSQNDKVHCLKAQKAIMACPKFAAGHIIKDLEPERLKVIRSMKYRSYLVANLLVAPRNNGTFYDMLMINQAHLNEKNLRSKAQAQGVTDIILANYAKDNPDFSVLTLYKPLAYDGSRGELFGPQAFSQAKAQLNDQIKKEILPCLGIRSHQVEGIRIARWGHPLPICEKGSFIGKKPQILRQPFRDRLFFVEQDNWMTPAFEICFEEAKYWSKKILKS